MKRRLIRLVWLLRAEALRLIDQQGDAAPEPLIVADISLAAADMQPLKNTARRPHCPRQHRLRSSAGGHAHKVLAMSAAMRCLGVKRG